MLIEAFRSCYLRNALFSRGAKDAKITFHQQILSLEIINVLLFPCTLKQSGKEKGRCISYDFLSYWKVMDQITLNSPFTRIQKNLFIFIYSLYSTQMDLMPLDSVLDMKRFHPKRHISRLRCDILSDKMIDTSQSHKRWCLVTLK